MKIRIIYRLALAGLLLSGLLFSGSLAQAHETRPVAGGKYSFRVGFINEPTYQGLENGLQLTVCKGDCVSSKDTPGTLSNGVTGAFDTLKAEVIYGGQSMPLTLTAVPRNPGVYDAPFVPTRAGDYTFHISGTLDTDKIDERFSSGPDTFDSVLPLTLVQFPDKPGYPAANSAAPAPTAAPPSPGNPGPTVQSLAQPTPAPAGIDAATVQDLRTQLNNQKQQLDDAKASAATANTLGLVGLVAGILGLVLAAFALLGRRGPKQPRQVEGG